MGIEAEYLNFDIPKIEDFRKILTENENLKGLNVTIPYKQEILPFLDQLDPVAAQIGAVNTIVFLQNGKLKGFNTDYFGFVEAIKPLLPKGRKKALILGTGGASKAVSFGLKSLGIDFSFVSRQKSDFALTYEELDQKIIEENLIIVNCTPLGTYPEIEFYPKIPFQFLTKNHLVLDLIYNPKMTKLMQISAEKGATVSNGLKMLELQAEKAWKLWNAQNP
jgi:shikimate dehydrogenase